MAKKPIPPGTDSQAAKAPTPEPAPAAPPTTVPPTTIAPEAFDPFNLTTYASAKPAATDAPAAGPNSSSGTEMQTPPAESPKPKRKKKATEPPPPPPVAADDDDEDAADGTPAPTVYRHSQRLLADARRFGFDPEFINHTPSNELDDLVYARQLEAETWARQKAEQDARAKEEADARARAAKSDEDVKLPFEDLDMDPRVKAWMIDQEKARRQTARALEEANKSVQQANERAAQVEAQNLRNQFQALCGKYPNLFGADRAGQARIRAVARELDALQPNERQATLEKDFELIREALFGQAQPIRPAPTTDEEEERDAKLQASNDKISETLRQRQQQFREGGLLTPTPREEIELPEGDQRAIRNLASKLKAETAGRLAGTDRSSWLNGWFGDQK